MSGAGRPTGYKVSVSLAEIASSSGDIPHPMQDFSSARQQPLGRVIASHEIGSTKFDVVKRVASMVLKIIRVTRSAITREIENCFLSVFTTIVISEPTTSLLGQEVGTRPPDPHCDTELGTVTEKPSDGNPGLGTGGHVSEGADRVTVGPRGVTRW